MVTPKTVSNTCLAKYKCMMIRPWHTASHGSSPLTGLNYAVSREHKHYIMIGVRADKGSIFLQLTLGQVYSNPSLAHSWAWQLLTNWAQLCSATRTLNFVITTQWSEFGPIKAIRSCTAKSSLSFGTQLGMVTVY